MNTTKRRNRKLYLEYDHKIKIAFAIQTITLLIVLLLLFPLFNFIAGLNLFPDNSRILYIGCTVIVALIIVEVWLSFWNAFTNCHTYAQFKITNPTINQIDASILIRAGVKFGRNRQ